MAPRSVYSDIVLQYRRHIGADIGEKPDIGGGNLRGCHNLRRYRRHIGADIGVNLPISVSYRGRYDSDIGVNYGTVSRYLLPSFGTPILSELSDIVS